MHNEWKYEGRLDYYEQHADLNVWSGWLLKFCQLGVK